MAEKKIVKIVITSHTKIGGKHVPKGEVIEIDPDNAADKNTYALLVHAGRIAEATDENIAAIKKEIAAEKEIELAHALAAKKSVNPSVTEIVAAVMAAMNAKKA